VQFCTGFVLVFGRGEKRFYRQDAEVAKRNFYKEKKKSRVAKYRGGAKKRNFRNGKMGIFYCEAMLSPYIFLKI